LEPYNGAIGDETDELLYCLMAVAKHRSYFCTEQFEQALIDELSAIKQDFEDNWEWEEEVVTR